KRSSSGEPHGRRRLPGHRQFFRTAGRRGGSAYYRLTPIHHRPRRRLLFSAQPPCSSLFCQGHHPYLEENSLKKFLAVIAVLVLIGLIVWFVGSLNRPQIGKIKDEALAAGREAESFPAADEDYFHDMDGGVPLTPAEIKGRNTWIVWSAGNDLMWDKLAVTSVGALDFVKVLSSSSDLKFTRDNRWEYFGLVNDPCFVKATGPDPKHFGLWLDQRRPECPPDPFENEQKYPGVKIGARGKNIPVGSYYGYQTGIVGLRLFPNPDFDEAAQKKWDPKRYYTDASYYNDKNLVRPYRVAMSCAFCHVGPN